jgi:hypothetical protein
MKVKLQEVLEALDGAGMDMEYYYDTKNEEILMIFDGMVNGETDPELIEDIEEHRTHWMQQSGARVHSADLRIGCTTLTFRKNGISTEMIAMSK